ncbi:response regulator [Rhodobaculum claviforme]|uniref:Sensory/regulatory protein RpfC n=1 Tax=Rhodobaculum claviforme TaxID=1549854 RepID=A0A934WJ28_9RHOB|nr:response regulator [Rhodobaculum claviforme]MBK5928740.1 hypothetical protein [Rhodobaculum claviforme]
MAWAVAGWSERLTMERRARLAAEGLLDRRTRALRAAQAALEARGRHIGTRLVAEREAAHRSAPPPGDTLDRLRGEAARAAHVAGVASRRLHDTMAAVEDGLALFDAAGRLLAANATFLRPYADCPDVRPGIARARLLRLCADTPLIELDGTDPDDWVATMQARWTEDPIPPAVLRWRDGPWMRLSDHRTRDNEVVCVALDITETVLLEERLRQEHERAEAAARAKAVFLSNMSHEIRTPMNGIVGMAEMLCDSDLTDDQRQCAETIRSSGEALLQVMNDILDFARAEGGRVILQPEAFDLERCIHEVVVMHQPPARDRGLALLVDYDLFLPTRLVADPGRVRQVLTHLIGNAVKFTAAGHVLVRVTGVVDGGGTCDLHLTVEDTGIGIAAAHLEQIFDRFTQLDAAENRRFEGTGLGLALTRRMIALMGGEIWVDSTPGAGACFGIRLSLPVAEEVAAPRPLPESLRHALVVDDRLVNRAILDRQLGALGVRVSSCHAAPEALRAVREDVPDVVVCTDTLPGTDGLELVAALRAQGWDGPVLLLSANPAGIKVAAAAALSVTVLQAPVLRRTLLARLADLCGAAADPPTEEIPAPPAPRRRMRVLSAEDNRTNQLVLAKMLKHLDIELTFADDGETAVAMYASFAPDLVFMDIAMPGMDGHEAARAIRAVERASGGRIPIVALTAHAPGDGGTPEWLDGCLTKPLRRAAITACIEEHAPAGVRPPTARPG